MKMKKIVVFSPVDWRWIKQRPQFLAEELSSYCTVSVIYPWRNRRKGLQAKSPSPVQIHPYFTVPEFGGRIPLLKKWNRFASKAQIAKYLSEEKPNYLWLTMPWQIDLIPENLDCEIVYDCMDDYASISMQSNMREQIWQQERRLTEAAKFIFASSAHLADLLNERFSLPAGKVHLLRNGYSADWTIQSPCAALDSSALRFGYFGTIGRWFDFELILKSLEACPRLEYHLFGPTENGVSVPQNPRIISHGVVEHRAIPKLAEQMDALVMPFIPNEIVQSVDPVKLYEYICLNKPILCIRYPEVERFAPFAILYAGQDEYIRAVSSVDKERAPRYSQQQAAAFLEKNSWAVRAKEVVLHMQLNKMED